MNGFYLAAALLTLLATLVHGIAGHQTNLKRLRASDVSPTEKLELQASWHLLTLTFGAMVLLLAWHAVTPLAPWIGSAALVLFALYGLVFFVYAIRAGTVWRTPQWLLLWGIALLIYLG